MSESIATVLETLFHENPELEIPVHQYNINVTTNMGPEISREEVFREFHQFDGAGRDAHLYLHLPLCDYICHFCNYVKRKISGSRKEQELQQWTDLLIEESRIYLRNAPWVAEARIRSFYIGGGTGGLLLNSPASMRRLMAHIRSSYSLAPDCEISIEGNPENFTSENIKLAIELGFNRFSVGVQSLSDPVNAFSNRGHSSDTALDSVYRLMETGRPFSVDLMFGLPLQTVESVSEGVAKLVDIGVPSITIYRLRNVEREKMGIGNASVWNKPRVKESLDSAHMLPSVRDTYRMRDAITDILRSSRYHPSPCGWWNRSGVYPDGNIPRVSKDKWEQYSTMLALGPGAYGWLTGDSRRVIQTHNISNISNYMTYMANSPKLPPLSHGRILEGNVAIGTRLMFGYKANQPISFGDYKRRFDVDLLNDDPFADVFSALLEREFIALSADGTSFLPTWKGEELHEEIMYRYFQEKIGGGGPTMCRRAAVG